jgi:hypothetical protein
VVGVVTLNKQYICDVCNGVFDNREKAQVCEDQGMSDIDFLVGDIVTINGKSRGWFDGKPHWVVEPETILNKNDPDDNTEPGVDGNLSKYYWAITEIDIPYGKHCWRIHLASKASHMNKPYLSNPKTKWRTGYTFLDRHVSLEVIDNPPKKVIDDSHDLLSTTSESLL